MSTDNKMLSALRAASNSRKVYDKVGERFELNDEFKVVATEGGYTPYKLIHIASGEEFPLKDGGGSTHIEIREASRDYNWVMGDRTGTVRAGTKAVYLV
jgi:hypothetical protein